MQVVSDHKKIIVKIIVLLEDFDIQNIVSFS